MATSPRTLEAFVGTTVAPSIAARVSLVGDPFFGDFVARKRRANVSWSAIALQLGKCEVDIRAAFDPEFDGSVIARVANVVAITPEQPKSDIPPVLRGAAKTLSASYYAADGSRLLIKRGGCAHVVLKLVDGRRDTRAIAGRSHIRLENVRGYLSTLKSRGLISAPSRNAVPTLTELGRRELERLA